MAANTTHAPEVIDEHGPGDPATEGLGSIAVRRDELQARARADAFLITIRAVRRGIAAVRARRGDD